jgi:photosystem II stability/assembly factor-like uncharacterized protein
MSRVRVLVGTRKGAFILSSDGKRDRWDVAGPHFGGSEVAHIKGSPPMPGLIFAAQSSPRDGEQLQRSETGGISWEAEPWEFARLRHIEPSPLDPDTVYAGTEDGRLLRSADGGRSWADLAGLPGSGAVNGMLLHPTDPNKMFVSVALAGAFRTVDGGASWQAIGPAVPDDLPAAEAEYARCVHHIVLHPSSPDRLYMQHHRGVFRSEDAGDSWEDVSGNLPSKFGYTIDIHASEPDTLYVVPMKNDVEHYPLEGKLRVYRTRTAGGRWEPLTTGLPQRDCYVNVLRAAMAVDKLDPCGAYFGTTGGAVYASSNAGDSWSPIVLDLPAVLSVEVQTTA